LAAYPPEPCATGNRKGTAGDPRGRDHDAQMLKHETDCRSAVWNRSGQQIEKGARVHPASPPLRAPATAKPSMNLPRRSFPLPSCSGLLIAGKWNRELQRKPQSACGMTVISYNNAKAHHALADGLIARSVHQRCRFRLGSGISNDKPNKKGRPKPPLKTAAPGRGPRVVSLQRGKASRTHAALCSSTDKTIAGRGSSEPSAVVSLRANCAAARSRMFCGSYRFLRRQMFGFPQSIRWTTDMTWSGRPSRKTTS
jgi:hypothetical protein